MKKQIKRENSDNKSGAALTELEHQLINSTLERFQKQNTEESDITSMAQIPVGNVVIQPRSMSAMDGPHAETFAPAKPINITLNTNQGILDGKTQLVEFGSQE